MDDALRAADRAAGRAGLQVFWVWERKIEMEVGAWVSPWKRLAGPFMFRVEAEQLLRERVSGSVWGHQVVLVEGDGQPVLPEDRQS